MEFFGWMILSGALIATLTKLSYQIVPPPKPTPPVNPWPLAPLQGDRPDNWIDKAIERKATDLVRVLPPPPPRPTIAETPENTGNTPPEHTQNTPTEHHQNTPPEHGNTPLEHTGFGEAQWEAVWRAIESGERSKSAIIRSVWGDGVNKSGKPGSQWRRCSEFIAGVIAEYERSSLERIERAYERS